jgi:hypothetical protein
MKACEDGWGWDEARVKCQGCLELVEDSAGSNLSHPCCRQNRVQSSIHYCAFHYTSHCTLQIFCMCHHIDNCCNLWQWAKRQYVTCVQLGAQQGASISIKSWSKVLYVIVFSMHSMSYYSFNSLIRGSLISLDIEARTPHCLITVQYQYRTYRPQNYEPGHSRVASDILGRSEGYWGLEIWQWSAIPPNLKD